MQGKVRLIAGLAVEENRKAAIGFAARVLGMSYDRVFRIYYAQAARIEAHEADRIRAFVNQSAEVIEGKRSLEADIRRFVSDARAPMGAMAPPALPDLEAESPSISRKRA